MKIFISQPMNGKTYDEKVSQRESALAKFKKSKFVRDQDIEVVNNKISASFSGNRVEFLGKAISEALSIADVAIFLPDWQEYAGCRIEHAVAASYSIKTFYINS